MVDIDDLRKSLHGPTAVEQLLGIVDSLQQQLSASQQQLQVSQQQLKSAQARIVELEKRLPPPKEQQAYSLDAEQKRQAKRRPNKNKRTVTRRGRLKTKDKIALAERTEQVFPEGVPPESCRLSHTRVLWRLEHGQAVLIAYEVYRGPNKQYGQIPGTLGRCEFGLEIVTQIAFLVHHVGLSFDKVVMLLHFFQNLELSKSQANRLLDRLAKQWEREFETLCALLAESLVVHADETSWSINSVWTLLSEKARLLVFGVNKDAETLKKLLDPAVFAGLVISDHAAVYATFSQMQKCWAHLLRKAIKLTLTEPTHIGYRQFMDGLLAIYQDARRLQIDQRFGVDGRKEAVTRLADRVWELCPPSELGEEARQRRLTGTAHEFELLVREVFDLNTRGELFVFVTTPPVEQPNGETKPVSGTNNEAERTLRPPALARKTGRVNKTLAGARRQTILASVLDSLRLYLKKYTFRNVMTEILRWQKQGLSCFEKLLRQRNLQPAADILDRLYPDLAATG